MMFWRWMPERLRILGHYDTAISESETPRTLTRLYFGMFYVLIVAPLSLVLLLVFVMAKVVGATRLSWWWALPLVVVCAPLLLFYVLLKFAAWRMASAVMQETFSHPRQPIELLSDDIERLSENCDECAANITFQVECLCSLKKYQDALVECDKAIGYFNELVERIEQMREAGSQPAHTLDKLEELAICRSLDMSRLADIIKETTGVALPRDYDPGFRVVKR